MKKKNEDEKNEFLFYSLSEVHILYAKTSIFPHLKCGQILLISLMIGKIELIKIVRKHRKTTVLGHCLKFPDNFVQPYLPNH